MKPILKTALYSACIAFGAIQAAVADPFDTDTASLISVDITYTGFCDGLHMDIDTATGKASGYATGCAPASCPAFGDYSVLPISAEVVLAESVCSYAGNNNTRWQYVINIANKTVDVWNYTVGSPPLLSLDNAPWDFGVAAAAAAASTSSSQD